MKKLAGSLMLTFAMTAGAQPCPEFLDYALPRLHASDTLNLCEEAPGRPLLIVNTASHCGYTRQFEGLEALYQTYRDRGLYVVGFASNDFNQEAADEAETARVCRENFGVTFTMVAPSYVTGQRANPVFREINRQTKEPDWNFNKYLVSPQGEVVAHFGSRTEPDSERLIQAIEALLSAQP